MHNSPSVVDRGRPRWRIATLVIGIAAGIGTPVASPLLAAPAPRPRAAAKPAAKSPYRKLELFAQVLSYLEREYVDKIKRDAVIENAIRGLVAGLDPHTQFFTAREITQLRTMLVGRWSGVGLEFTRRGGRVTVISALPGGPAHRAGIRSGDWLLGIDGRSVRRARLDTLHALMRGRRGSRLTLTMLRPGSKTPERIVLVRDLLRASDVLKAALPGGIGYVLIRKFSHGVARQARAAFESLIKLYGTNLRGLIIDLRDNPGGLMDEGVRLADQFLSGGLIVRKIGKRGRLNERELAQPKRTFPDHIKLAILVNGGTASAAEVVSGALGDRKRALVVGSRTFGKGSIQAMIRLPGGAQLKMTVARYYTPSGRSIQGKGVQPHLKVSEKNDRDPPLGKLATPRQAIKIPTVAPKWTAGDAALGAAIRRLTAAPGAPR